MFVAKSCQTTLFDLEFALPEPMYQRLKATWADVFLQVVMPLLLKAEHDFADLYCSNNGAPNTPVALLLGILVLKDMFDLTDEETLEHLEYNLLWQHALATRFEDAHICRKTLHNFRVKLLQSGKHRPLFTSLTKQIIERFSLKIGRQRLDSTHIIGKMKLVGRLGLFVQTIEQFLFKLKRMGQKNADIAKLVQELPAPFHQRYLAREGYFGDARSSQAPRRLQTCAQDIWLLLQLFANDPTISELKQFKTLKRLFNEQCEVGAGADEPNSVQVKSPDRNEAADSIPADPGTTETPPTNDNQAASQTPRTAATVAVKPPATIETDSLQSPTDPDATYGHKGKGYEYQIAETCAKANPFQVITQTQLNGANESDQTQTLPMLEQLAAVELKPEDLLVDAGYVSGDNLVQAENQGTRLVGPLPGKPPNPASISLAEFQFAEHGTLLMQCPNHLSPVQQGHADHHEEYWAVFAQADCAACPLAANCPVQGKRARRLVWNREKIATARRQQEVKTKAFKEEYKMRSGIEATNSELKHKHGAARLEVCGHVRIDLALTFKSLAINVKRMLLHVLAQCKRLTTDGIGKPVAAILGALASLLLIFAAVARLNRRWTYFALKGMDLDAFRSWH